MASLGFTSDTATELMTLIDDNRQNVSEGSYVEIANAVKFLYDSAQKGVTSVPSEPDQELLIQALHQLIETPSVPLGQLNQRGSTVFFDDDDDEDEIEFEDEEEKEEEQEEELSIPEISDDERRKQINSEITEYKNAIENFKPRLNNLIKYNALSDKCREFGIPFTVSVSTTPPTTLIKILEEKLIAVGADKKYISNLYQDSKQSFIDERVSEWEFKISVLENELEENEIDEVLDEIDTIES